MNSVCMGSAMASQFQTHKKNDKIERGKKTFIYDHWMKSQFSAKLIIDMTNWLSSIRFKVRETYIQKYLHCIFDDKKKHENENTYRKRRNFHDEN